MTPGKVIALRRVGGPTEDVTDESLVAACARGDRAALGALFDRYHDAVRVFVAHTVPADGDLDDLVQTTFETAQRAAHRFRGEAKVKTWLLGIARNVARHHVRARTRRRIFALALLAEPTPPSTPPDELLHQTQRLDRLSHAIRALSPKLREVFVLVYVQGMTDAEAAEILDLKVGAVWKRLHDARRLIREQLGAMT